MQRAGQKMQEVQQALDARGCASVLLGVAGLIMCFAFCPFSILAVSCSYWNTSSDTVSSSSSLWKVSITVEMAGTSAETEMDMCGDEMNNFDDCGKIDALRFFTITATLLSFTAAALIMTGFSPVLKSDAQVRRKVSLVGAILAPIMALWVFLSICIAASVDVPDASLNGAGFVSLVLELLALVPVHVLLYFALMPASHSTQEPSAMVGVLPQAQKAAGGPSLLGSPNTVFVKPKSPAKAEDVASGDLEQGLSDGIPKESAQGKVSEDIRVTDVDAEAKSAEVVTECATGAVNKEFPSAGPDEDVDNAATVVVIKAKSRPSLAEQSKSNNTIGVIEAALEPELVHD